MLDSLDTLIAFVLIMLVVSLLITIAVQMTSAVLNLRSLNLLSGLGSAFAVIAPTLDETRKDLARYVLKSRLLSDSFLPVGLSKWPRLQQFFDFWRPTSAARPREIFDAIHRIAISQEPASESIRNNARTLLNALGIDNQTLDTAQQAIVGAGEEVTSLRADANRALESVVPDQELRTRVQSILNSVTDRVNAYGITAARETVAAAGVIDAAFKKFNYWACICEERAQQWLTMHTRIFTILFAFIAAFWLQLDTVEIFKLVSSNKAVRDKLVAQAGAVEAQAAKTFGDSSNVLQEALKAWSEKETDPAIKNAMASIKVDTTDTRGTARKKVEDALKPLAPKTPVNSFDEVVNDAATQRLEKQAAEFKEVQADFNKSGFDLFPKNAGRWGNAWEDGWDRHLMGVLFSVALLSLGAPFWYSILKNLVDLRSQVAQNISTEKKQNQPDNPNQPPPTVQSASSQADPEANKTKDEPPKADPGNAGAVAPPVK